MMVFPLAVATANDNTIVQARATREMAAARNDRQRPDRAWHLSTTNLLSKPLSKADVRRSIKLANFWGVV